MENPFIFILFGATGDLAHNKLFPALFALFKEKRLPLHFLIVGFARRQLTDEAFAALFSAYQNDADWTAFSKHLRYHQGSFEDEQSYISLGEKLAELDTKIKEKYARIYYLATPPQNYDTILHMLEKYKKQLLQTFLLHGRFAKLAIEKPFGKDLETAQQLDRTLSTSFKDWQVFRVDHYLGKETVQNMLVFRFANNIFDPVWNSENIDHVQITFAESKGIGNRGKFYDGVGELRDIGQNHLLQLLAAVAMEMPKSFSSQGVRDARADAIKALRIPDISHVVRAQYDDYTKESDVPKNSQTETFIAIKTFVETPRFQGVPFYIRAGKKLAQNHVSISVVFRQTCHILFKAFGCPEEGNVLTFNIQPNEGITLAIVAKSLGEHVSLKPVNMHFTYQESFMSRGHDAYEKIMVDILSGDQMLFNRSDELESSWRFITEILKKWEKNDMVLSSYTPESWGPKAAQELIEKDGRKWLNE